MEDLKNLKSEALAAQVVIYRMLGINKELSIKCMEELLIRKNNSDEFDYEKYIIEELNKSPKINDQEVNMLKNLMKLNFKDIVNE